MALLARGAHRDRADRVDGHVARRLGVSGFYFAHPDSQYFVVGRIGRDQVVWQQRKGWDLRTAERWLGPNLGYQPED